MKWGVTDLFKLFPPHYGSASGAPYYSPRKDVVPDGVINISGVFKLLPPVFGWSCG